MKYVMAAMLMTLGACAGPRNEGRPASPPVESVSTTEITSSALIHQGEPVTVDNSPAPIVAVKETDRNLATSIRSSLGRDKALESVPWQRVSMEVEDQHVTLRGQLPTLADSTEVERVVRATKGVRAVSNEIRTNDAHQQ